MGQKETDQLNQILHGVALTRAMCTVADLGVADHIQAGASRSAAYLAQATGAHERSLYRLLRFLASHGLFRETKSGEFDHTPLSLALRGDAEGSFRAAAQLFHYEFRAWDGLDHAVRTGKPGFDAVFGRPLFDHIAAHPQLGPLLDAGMTCMHGYETAAMIEAYDFGAVRVLADIGGGNGSLIGAVLQRYPKMRGILFDLGHVVGRARESLKKCGVANRCQVIEGSFFETIPAGPDAYLFRHIIHDWTDEQSVQILSLCRKVIPEDGRLLLVECVVPPGNGPSLSKEFDMTMMTFPGGVERTESEFRSLFKHAGFELMSVTPTTTMVSVVEGRPAPVPLRSV
ncbi:MAG TPA: methyltransferase [Candidatus Acidoferrales bacterium]|nr:methyltransferase [Candidatus Acidoferrales bacterium]